MNILVYLGIAIIAYLFAGRFYARFIAKTLGEDDSSPTPAQKVNDGVDYVPTKAYVVFAHHFSSIAGAGPILGPTVAILYGFIPAWLWVVLGGIFMGAVHDFTGLFICMKEGGKSMAEVAKKTMGNTGFNLFISFTILMIILVTSSFLNATSMSLTSLWPVDKLGVTDSDTILKTVTVDGVVMGKIGGIASTSVIFITLLSPFLGWLIYKKNISSFLAIPLATAICVLSVYMGILHPIALPAKTWMIIVSVYVFLAAGAPVWIILQPRDFINSQILFGGLILMFVAILKGGMEGFVISMPNFNLDEGVKSLGLIWPMMFITIACGAISGFHALVSGGTTSKQLEHETDARKVGFNAMLLESALAVCVLIALGATLSFADYKSIVWPTDPGVKSNPILGFALGAGHLFNQALGIRISLSTVFGILLVEGFVITTLDTAVRLNRYLFEELWAILFKNPPAIMKKFWFNSGLSVILMWVLAYSNAFSALWPIFGTANQLLAALALFAVSSWLLMRGKKFVFTLLPGIFMMVTTMASLVILFFNYQKKGNYILMVTDALLFALSIGVVYLVINRFTRHKQTA
ncbi:MAG: carbon starvation protein A [Spirochaetae bacterium HGW-Spirochaetae-1]|jgi:carbon starvation protein|nr:MAG: carbon starvation protein A [Spirochaetae bacterium HGW-Spirochaetae-1]